MQFLMLVELNQFSTKFTYKRDGFLLQENKYWAVTDRSCTSGQCRSLVTFL